MASYFPVVRDPNIFCLIRTKLSAVDALSWPHNDQFTVEAPALSSNPDKRQRRNAREGTPDVKIQTAVRALRFDNTLKNPSAGFVFGSNEDVCDVLLDKDVHNSGVSGTHFRVFSPECAQTSAELNLELGNLSRHGTVIDGTKYSSGKTVPMLPGAVFSIEAGLCHLELKYVKPTPASKRAFLVNMERFRKASEVAPSQSLSAQSLSALTMHQKRVTPQLFADQQWISTTEPWASGKFYVLHQQMRSTGQGRIKRVQRVGDGAIFAAKVVTSTHASLSLENEVRVLRSLIHEHIAMYIDHASIYNGTGLVIAIEHAEFGDISSYLEDQMSGPPRPGNVKTMGRQILLALKYMHGLGYVHGNVDIRKILVFRMEPLCVKLCDFRIAHKVDSDIQPIVMQESSPYVAPELKSRKRKNVVLKGTAEQACDIWAAGVVIYQLVSGHLSPQDIGDAELDSEMLQEYIPKLFAMYSDLVSSMMAKLSKDRPDASSCLRYPCLVENYPPCTPVRAALTVTSTDITNRGTVHTPRSDSRSAYMSPDRCRQKYSSLPVVPETDVPAAADSSACSPTVTESLGPDRSDSTEKVRLWEFLNEKIRQNDEEQRNGPVIPDTRPPSVASTELNNV